MSNKYNYKKLSNVELIPIKDNFLGCRFICKSIAVNIPDTFATNWENSSDNGFMIIADLYKDIGTQIGLIEKNVEILINTNQLHTIEEIGDIILDITKQHILLRKYGKYYHIEGNNYKIEVA